MHIYIFFVTGDCADQPFIWERISDSQPPETQKENLFHCWQDLCMAFYIGHLEIGEHEFQNVSVRQFNGKACISTTLQTEMKVLEDCGSWVETVQTEIVTVEGEIIDTELRVNHLCPKYQCNGQGKQWCINESLQPVRRFL